MRLRMVPVRFFPSCLNSTMDCLVPPGVSTMRVHVPVTSAAKAAAADNNSAAASARSFAKYRTGSPAHPSRPSEPRENRRMIKPYL